MAFKGLEGKLKSNVLTLEVLINWFCLTVDKSGLLLSLILWHNDE